MVALGVEIIETGRRVDWLGHHYADAALEYLLAPLLVRHIPEDVDALVCFGPPAMPALWWARRRGWGVPRRPLLAFLYEPPRFVDRDREDVVTGLGAIGVVARPLLGLYRRIDRQFVKSADALLANGDYGAQRLHEAYGRTATVLPHGVDFCDPDVTEAAAIRERYRIGPDAPILLTVNQLHPRKRLDLFLQTIAAVHREFPAVQGMIVGRGVDETRLRAEAARLGITDAVIFAGFVPDDALAAIYGAANVYLHTGRDETFGLSVLEAAWSGLPVVSVNEGGTPDILRRAPKAWVVPADTDALAKAVTSILSDQSAARIFAALVRDDVRARFRWEDGAAALIAEVERLRASRASQLWRFR